MPVSYLQDSACFVQDRSQGVLKTLIQIWQHWH